MRADKSVLLRALKYVHAIKRRNAEYLEECESYYRRGFTPEFCIHGKYLWTDYDAICGWCEDGEESTYKYALRLAKRDFADFHNRIDWLNKRPDRFDQPMPNELFNQIMAWVIAPLKNVDEVRFW